MLFRGSTGDSGNVFELAFTPLRHPSVFIVHGDRLRNTSTILALPTGVGINKQQNNNNQTLH